MIKMKLLAVVFVTILTFTGCLKVNTTVSLNPDGTGEIEETVMIKSEILDMIRQFAGAFDETKNSEEFSFYKEEEQKNKASSYGEGITFKGGMELKETDWEGYKVVYSFTDINKLKINPSPDDKISLGEEIEKTEETTDEFLTFKFNKGNPSDLRIIFPKPDFDDSEPAETIEPDSVNADMTEMFRNMFDGMKISVNLRVKGKIQETNASFVSDNTITMMEIDFTNLLKNDEIVKTLESQKPKSLEDFRELTKDIEGIKIDFNDEIKVKFK